MMSEGLDENVFKVRVNYSGIGEMRCEKCTIPDLKHSKDGFIIRKSV